MTAPANSHHRSDRLAMCRMVTLRSLVTQIFLLATLFGGPGLARQAPEVETHAEASIALLQSACDRARSSRLHTRLLEVSIDRTEVLVRTVRSGGIRSTRGLPPRWLRNDLPAPLLC